MSWATVPLSREAGHPCRHSLHSAILRGTCVCLRILLWDHVTATTGARRDGRAGLGTGPLHLQTWDSHPWDWGWEAASQGGTRGPATKTRPVPEECSQDSGPSSLVRWTAPAQSSSRPTLRLFLHRGGCAQARPPRVCGDDNGCLILPPRQPLLPSPAGGTGSGSSGGWKNREVDASRRWLSGGEGAAGVRPQGRATTAPGEGSSWGTLCRWGLGHRLTCPLILHLVLGGGSGQRPCVALA